MPSPLYIVRGAIFVWSHKTLWKYAVAPILISIVTLAGCYILLYDLFIKLISPYTGQEWYGKVVYYLLLVIITVALLAAFFFIVTRLASAMSAPFNDVISQKTEEIAAGMRDENPFSPVRLLRDSGRSLAHSFRLLGVYIGLLVVGLLLLLVPGIGGALYTAFGVLVSAYMFAYEYLGYSMDRRRFSWAQKRSFLRSEMRSILGFGLGSVAVAAVPIINFFFIPAAVAGGTLLFLDLTRNSRNGSAAWLVRLRKWMSDLKNDFLHAAVREFLWLLSYGRPKTVIASPAEKRGKQSPVIPVETGIQEGRIAMRPYKMAFSRDAGFHSSQ